PSRKRISSCCFTYNISVPLHSVLQWLYNKAVSASKSKCYVKGFQLTNKHLLIKFTSKNGKRSQWVCKITSKGRCCKSVASSRPCFGRERGEYHGVLQAVQCADPRQARQSVASRDYGV